MVGWDILTQFAACGDPKAFKMFPTWYKYLGEESIAGKCSPIINFPDDIGKILLALAEILLRLGGMVAVAFVIFGGIKYILSQGEPDNAKKALNTIINALIGLAIAASATVIVNLVAGSLI